MHELVGADLLRRPLDDHASVVHHRHPLGDAKRDVHVVLDQDQRDLAVEREQQVRQQRSLASREAGRGLVEHQDLRVGRERHRERDLAVLAVRERADELVELVGDCDATRGRARPLAELLVPLGDDDGPQAAARDAEHGEIDVVLDAEPGKEPRLLVGTREP